MARTREAVIRGDKTPDRRARRGDGGLHYNARRDLYVARLELPPDPKTGERRRKEVTARSKHAAVAKLKALRAQLDRTGDLPLSSPTLAAWMTRWLETVDATRKPSTAADYHSKVTLYILPTIGMIRLERLTPDHVRRVHSRITDAGLSSTTALTTHRILARALKAAEREGLVQRNVANLVDPPVRAVVADPSLNAEQAITLLEHTAGIPGVYPRAATSLLTGMRQGEALGMHIDYLDLDRARYTIAWQLQRIAYRHGCGGYVAGKGWPCGRMRGGNCLARQAPIPAGMEARFLDGGLWLIRPKTKAGWRSVPLVPMLVDALGTHLDANPPGPHGLVFAGPGGRPIDPAADSRAWHAALASAGLPSVKLHSTRHTVNTLLHALGVDATTRQAILGHATLASNELYIDDTSDQAREALIRLSKVLGRQPDGELV